MKIKLTNIDTATFRQSLVEITSIDSFENVFVDVITVSNCVDHYPLCIYR